MKKIQFAIAAAAVCMMVACTGQAGKDATVANADSTEVQAEPQEAAEPTVETRGTYKVAVPAGWESKQYVSNMLLKKDGVTVDVKEWSGNEITPKTLENVGCKAENKLDDIVTGDITWVGYKDAKDFKKVYMGVVDNTVVRIGADDANVDLKPILEGVSKL